MKWFQVDSDTPNDPKIKAIIRVGLPHMTPGQAAAGALLLLWCYIADHGAGFPGEGVDDNGFPLPLAEVADECLFPSTEALIDWLGFLADKRLIDPERWKENQTVVLPAMRKRADSYQKSKGRDPDRRESTRAGGKRPLQDNTNTTDTTGQDQDLFALAGDTPVRLRADDLVKVWNDHRKSGPAVREVSDARRKGALAALHAEPDLDRWAALVDWIETQDWMNACGTGDYPTWRADFDFMVRPKQFPKLFDRMAVKAPAKANGRVAPQAGKFKDVDK